MDWRKKLLKLVEPELGKLDIAHWPEHSLRAYKLCETIAKGHKDADLDVLYAICLLHDIGQVVNKKGVHSHNSVIFAEKYLKEVGFPDESISKVIEGIRKHDQYAWVKGHNGDMPRSVEAIIFQDADRIESLGAIGMGRHFIWAGKNDKLMYDNKPEWKDDVAYGGNTSVIHTMRSTMNAYDHLNTKEGKKIAKERYEFSKLFIKQFLKEWTQ